MNLHDLKKEFAGLWWVNSSPCRFNCLFPNEHPTSYMHSECLRAYANLQETPFSCECTACEKRNGGLYMHLMAKKDKHNDKDGYYLCHYCITGVHPTQ